MHLQTMQRSNQKKQGRSYDPAFLIISHYISKQRNCQVGLKRFLQEILKKQKISHADPEELPESHPQFHDFIKLFQPQFCNDRKMI